MEEVEKKDCNKCKKRECLFRNDTDYCPIIEENRPLYKTINIHGVLKSFRKAVDRYKDKAKYESDLEKKKYYQGIIEGLDLGKDIIRLKDFYKDD